MQARASNAQNVLLNKSIHHASRAHVLVITDVDLLIHILCLDLGLLLVLIGSSRLLLSNSRFLIPTILIRCGLTLALRIALGLALPRGGFGRTRSLLGRILGHSCAVAQRLKIVFERAPESVHHDLAGADGLAFGARRVLVGVLDGVDSEKEKRGTYGIVELNLREVDEAEEVRQLDEYQIYEKRDEVRETYALAVGPSDAGLGFGSFHVGHFAVLLSDL